MVVKNGKQNGKCKQRYKCNDCTRCFDGGERLNSAGYIQNKTRPKLNLLNASNAVMHNHSLSKKHIKNNNFASPNRVNLLMNTTYLVCQLKTFANT